MVLGRLGWSACGLAALLGLLLAAPPRLICRDPVLACQVAVLRGETEPWGHGFFSTGRPGYRAYHSPGPDGAWAPRAPDDGPTGDDVWLEMPPWEYAGVAHALSLPASGFLSVPVVALLLRASRRRARVGWPRAALLVGLPWAWGATWAWWLMHERWSHSRPWAEALRVREPHQLLEPGWAALGAWTLGALCVAHLVARGAASPVDARDPSGPH